MKFLMITIFSIFFYQSSFAFDHNHTLWQKTLDKYYKLDKKQALFNYKKSIGDKELDTYLQQLSSVSNEEFKSFNEKQRLSFLINAYNAFTVKLINDNYPVKSIKRIGSLFKSAWKKKFFTFLGKKTHLDHIEHTLIRKNFKEPRIHFAVVCASISCPNLQPKAFNENNLESLLEKGAKDFFNDSNKNKYDPKSKTYFISKIFKWYGDDFKDLAPSINDYVSTYIPTNLKASETNIDYLRYNWDLNEWE